MRFKFIKLSLKNIAKCDTKIIMAVIIAQPFANSIHFDFHDLMISKTDYI